MTSSVSLDAWSEARLMPRSHAAATDFVELEVMDEVIVASLKAFCEKGGGVLPYPGSNVPALELWYASNRVRSSRESRGAGLAGAWAAVTGSNKSPWKGRFAKQVRPPAPAAGTICTVHTEHAVRRCAAGAV